MARLEEYRRKRKFSETPEPSGKTRERGGNRFVVQEHHARRLHYDFRLEIDGVLKSWAVPKGPSMNPADKRLAVQTEDHPLEYGSFHGTIPAGHYGAGEVKIWDEGHFQPEGVMSASDQLKRGELKFVLDGQKLRGSFVLVRLRNRDSSKPEWLLIKHKDALTRGYRDQVARTGPASPNIISTTQSKPQNAQHQSRPEISSARSAVRAKSRIKMPTSAQPSGMPHFIRPALATLTDHAFSNPEWLFEIKWDGVRTLTAVRDGKVQMWSRSERDITREYPEMGDIAKNVDAHEAWLDGEIVTLDRDGRSDFQKLQLRFGVQKPPLKLIEQVPVVYYVFDLLYLDGHDLRNVPLLERKDLLRQVLRDDNRLRYSDHVAENGSGLFNVATARHLEGIVAKEMSSPYPSGRSSKWLKIKLEKDLDAVVGGWTDPRGAREYFGALLLGLYEGEKFEFIGGVGSGFSAEVQEHLWSQLQNLRISECPFANEPATREQAYWTKPELVARVHFSNWTSDRHLRQPRYVGLQEDHDPQSCTFEDQANVSNEKGSAAKAPRGKKPGTDDGQKTRRKSNSRTVGNAKRQSRAPEHPTTEAPSTEEQIQKELTSGTSDNINVELDGRQLHFTNLNKVYFPKDGYRKRDLLAHYLWAAPMILPFLKDRPLVLRRYPNGIEEKAFFQKDAARGTPDWVKTVAIASDSADRSVNYFIANDRPTLLYLTNLGCIDHNPWSSCYDDQDHPDYIFFDLDPSEGTSFETVIKFGRLLLKTLDNFNIKAFAKTSGATGFHIFIPIEPRYTFEQARLFVRAIGNVVTRKHPGVLTFERTVNKRRRDSIYLDAHQNSRGQSLACAYSVRAFQHAPVSAPVRADELTSALAADQCNLKTIRARVEKVGDLWAKFWKSRQRLETLFKQAGGERPTQV
ncbi:MAG: DNA ligase D [Candidatus Acidiferrales bacterium]